MVEQSDPQVNHQDAQDLAPIPELNALAQALRQARIDQGLSLGELAGRLHMGLEQLRAFENADRAALPEQVFVIAQARRIAAALGIEVADQIAALRSSDVFNKTVPVLTPETFKAPPPRKPATLASHVRHRAVSVGGGALLGWGLVVVVLAGGAGALWWQRDRWQPLLANGGRQPPGPTRPSPAANAKRGLVAPAAAAVLLVRAPRTSWLEVQSLPANTRLYKGMFKGEKRFPLGQGLRLLAGRPDQVQVAVGAAQPKTLGTIKDIRWFSFKPAPQPAPPTR
ncbi:MAG: hypothetical protein FJ077_01880 [Cyanobacteria bacterium K_DeepCast_35m_m2_023]|nr:hypothetical protein [Cyanobacteria bacterium K_DeepCast_35m_m2_023]